MKYLTNYKQIEILGTSPFFPYSVIHPELIDHDELHKELLRVKKIVALHPLPSYSYDRSYLLNVAKLFGVKLTFKTMSKNSETRGLCWPEENKIQVSLKKDYSYNKCTLTHELGHILLVKFGMCKEDGVIFLSTELKNEQQAETISYFLCKLLWPKQRFSKKSFNCYFEEEDIIWLDEFYKRQTTITYINDVFKIKECGKKKSGY